MKNGFATRVALAIFALALAVSAATPLWGLNPPKITFNVKFAPPKTGICCGPISSPAPATAFIRRCRRLSWTGRST